MFLLCGAFELMPSSSSAGLIKSLWSREPQVSGHVTAAHWRLVVETDVKAALSVYDYQYWMFKRKKHYPTINKGQKQQKDMPSVALPCIRGLSEQLTNFFHNHGLGTYHKPFNTIRLNMLVNPKDKTPDLKKCWVVYEIPCADCHKK